MPNDLETTIGAFEVRMALRRRMLSITGVHFPVHDPSEDLEALLKQSVINCFECENGDCCARWLEAAKAKTSPPAFCRNRGTYQQLNAMGCVR